MSSHKTEQEARLQKNENTRQLLWSMADTTWRMFLAPALLVPAGIYGDLSFRTKPWLTVIAAVLGLGLSVLLVRQQLRGSQ